MTRERLNHLALTFSALLAAGPAFSETERYGNGYRGHMWDGGWGIFGAGSMILFWVLVIVLVIVAVKWLSQQGQASGNSGGNALRTLEERLAKGEIDVAEFEERKRVLTS